MPRDTPSTGKAEPRPVKDLDGAVGDGLELRLDPSAPPGDALPPLARLLRKLRDRARAESKHATSSPQKVG